MKYAVEYIEAPNPEALAVEMNNFFAEYSRENETEMSVRNISYLSNAVPDPFSPQKIRVSFIALITYRNKF